MAIKLFNKTPWADTSTGWRKKRFTLSFGSIKGNPATSLVG